MAETGHGVRNFLIALTRNPVGLVGAALTTAAGILILVLFSLSFVGFEGGAYSGILTYMILPAFFVVGLLLMPLGAWIERRSIRRAVARGAVAPAFPVIDLNRHAVRRVVLIFFAATVLNVAILAMATYKSVEVMESVPFCGATCHTVMEPEFTTYQRSPHARVACVQCHIGPGAGWFVKSKLSGAWQVVSVAFDLYQKPIPVPVHNLRPARETCEQCHWPAKFVGDRLKVITRYDEDEKNSEKKTVLLMRVGGLQGPHAKGIHWHVAPDTHIRYRADASRQVIHEVELTKADGTFKRWRADEDPGSAAQTDWRAMDCVDCHNRPSHVYRPARDEVDDAIRNGRIDRTLPWVRREGLKALTSPYDSCDDARVRTPEGLLAFYRENYPDVTASRSGAIREAGEALAGLWCQNVFPTMNISWGAYPTFLGHDGAPGCFRCHDDLHKADDGSAISQDCTTCHSILAMEEEDPQILSALNP